MNWTRETIEERLHDAVDGRLTPEELAGFRAALEKHPDLAQEFDDYAEMRAILGDLGTPSAPEGLRESIVQATRTAPQERPGFWAPFAEIGPVRVAALLLVPLVLAAVLWKESTRETTDAPRHAANAETVDEQDEKRKNADFKSDEQPRSKSMKVAKKEMVDVEKATAQAEARPAQGGLNKKVVPAHRDSRFKDDPRESRNEWDKNAEVKGEAQLAKPAPNKSSARASRKKTRGAKVGATVGAKSKAVGSKVRRLAITPMRIQTQRAAPARFAANVQQLVDATRSKDKQGAFSGAALFLNEAASNNIVDAVEQVEALRVLAVAQEDPRTAQWLRNARPGPALQTFTGSKTSVDARRRLERARKRDRVVQQRLNRKEVLTDRLQAKAPSRVYVISGREALSQTIDLLERDGAVPWRPLPAPTDSVAVLEARVDATQRKKLIEQLESQALSLRVAHQIKGTNEKESAVMRLTVIDR